MWKWKKHEKRLIFPLVHLWTGPGHLVCNLNVTRPRSLTLRACVPSNFPHTLVLTAPSAPTLSTTSSPTPVISCKTFVTTPPSRRSLQLVFAYCIEGSRGELIKLLRLRITRLPELPCRSLASSRFLVSRSDQLPKIRRWQPPHSACVQLVAQL